MWVRRFLVPIQVRILPVPLRRLPALKCGVPAKIHILGQIYSFFNEDQIEHMKEAC